MDEFFLGLFLDTTRVRQPKKDKLQRNNQTHDLNNEDLNVRQIMFVEKIQNF